MGKGGGRKLIAGVVAWSAVAALAVVASAAPAGAAPSRSPIRFWGPNVSYTGDAGAAKKTHAMEKLGNVLYVGGNFDTIAPEPATTNNNGVAGVAQPHLYAVDATTGAYLPQFAPQLNGPVYALEVDPATGTLYVGGTFTTVNGQSLTGLAVLDTTTGALKGTQRSLANTGGAPGAYALHLVGRQLYVGGQFTSIGGVAKGQLAKLAVDAANQVDPAFQSYFDGGKVLSLSSDDTKLYRGRRVRSPSRPGRAEPTCAGTRFLGGGVRSTPAPPITTFIPNVPCPGTCTTETRGREHHGHQRHRVRGLRRQLGPLRRLPGDAMAPQLAMWEVRRRRASGGRRPATRVFVGGHFEPHHQRCRAIPLDATPSAPRSAPWTPSTSSSSRSRTSTTAATSAFLHRRPRRRRHLLGRPHHPLSTRRNGRRLRRRSARPRATATSCGVVEGGGPADTAVPDARRPTCMRTDGSDRLHRRHRGPPRPTTPP